MSAYPAWTPASRPGIVPLHPLGFGMLLGRSFAALRHNPRVLLGFALAVQGIVYLIGVVVVGAVSFAMFARLDNVAPGSAAYQQILAGSVGVTVLLAIVLGLLLGAFGVLVQAVVVVDVARGVLAERPTLREIWAQVRPVAWRLIGYAALLTAVALGAVGGAAGIAIAVGVANVAVGVIVAVLALLAGIPVWLWLSAKLLLVPAAILLEKATVMGGIARSWRLTRGRFWPVLGVIVVIQAAFIALGEVVAVPFSLLGSLAGTVLAPTGDASGGLVVQLIVTGIVQVVVLIIQVIGSIVQATASCLLYVDCRMRHEGLDLDLLSYVERRDAGETGLPDPFTVGIGRLAAPRQPMQPASWSAPPPAWAAPAPSEWAAPAPSAWGPPPQTGHPLWGPPPQVPPQPAAAASTPTPTPTPPASAAEPPGTAESSTTGSSAPAESSPPPTMAPPR